MNDILRRIRDNAIDYDKVIGDIIRYSAYEKELPYDVNVIIPARGRTDFLPVLIKTLKSANQDGLLICITVVEHDNDHCHFISCQQYGVDYIWVSSDNIFNKSLAFNIGAILGNRAKWLICHDLDCLVQNDFYGGVLGNIKNKNTPCVQSFNKRRVIYCDHHLTPLLINGSIDINSLNPHSPNTFIARGEAPGGSITISRDFFFRVGGYDPELFNSYSPEDRFFWDKISLYVQIGVCDNPVVDVYHLNHPPSINTNPKLKEMIKISDKFRILSSEEQKAIINYKSKLLSKYR